MKLRLSFFLLFGFIFTILTCNESINSSSIAPDKVIFVDAVPDTSETERGIDAIPEDDAILIQWVPLTGANVQSYEIWRSELESGKFNKLSDAAKQDSIYIDRQVEIYKTYLYCIYAVNSDNIKGESSDTISYQLYAKADYLNPTGDISETTPIFSWEDPNQASEYIIRLYEQQSGQLIWMSMVSSSYSNRETVVYNFDGKADYTNLKPNQDYYWRVDVVGNSSYLGAGSESHWALFHVQ